ncbi:alcohol dehydrogenase, propanol-preferring/NAD+-dependent secondary alcohol dehydrogenase Adh1 [Halobiforma haloterrestris]|uniref:Alcohol dehydrogenase, propanol-preferring/NAD+-dependent secondary alcohol dehydrogenase Adh1 n=1 Tax=Natronobacterium haloterrestre TaxID=148448 RepID=A0A1I1HUL1_NATHA|nr:NAD(P)-dependent alcohol dehydrogenase [Halobiforma haloterrestris]SFC25113.1 alcohol dehydrogenase, propanol-preferring/NAD+-dependent secondary alcohol dehydrogenase Adh1 [Halobiforma haloterrestris]
MQAARLHEYTDEMDAALEIDDVDRPEIDRSDGVLVEVEGAGWCQTDNHIVEGMWDEYVEQELPMTLGHENAGIVAEVGDEVQLVEAGDPVLCHPVQTCGICRPCRRGEDMYCENQAFNGLTTDGGFAEYVLTNERAVVPLPDGVDPTEIAPHADAGITAYHAAKKATDELNPGDTCVLIGIGGLGHIGLQCVDAMSAADVVAVDLKDEALELATDLGADHTVDSSEEDVASVVADLTDDGGVEQVLDFVGRDETTALAPEIVAQGGDHHVVGYGGHVHEPCQAMVFGEFSFRGALVGRYAELQELVALVDRGDVELHTERHDLGEINEVAERLERGEIEGRAVIQPP